MIYVARFIPEKNHRFLLDYVEEYGSSLPAPVCFVSSDSIPQSLKKRCDNLREKGLLEIFKQPSCMNQLYNSSRFVVFVSEYTEGCPNTIIEAYACGLPVVCTDLHVNLNLPCIFFKHNNLGKFNKTVHSIMDLQLDNSYTKKGYELISMHRECRNNAILSTCRTRG